MSLRDGELVRKELYLTSDRALAAYLITRGFEFLGAVDSGKTGMSGKKRLDFGFTSTDPEILANMNAFIESAADEFENTYFQVPHNQNLRVNFSVYYKSLNKLNHSLDEPIKKEEI